MTDPVFPQSIEQLIEAKIAQALGGQVQATAPDAAPAAPEPAPEPVAPKTPEERLDALEAAVAQLQSFRNAG